MRSFTSEAFIIWTLHFLAQNTSEMRSSQKSEVTSLKVFTIKNSKIEIRNENEEKLEKGK